MEDKLSIFGLLELVKDYDIYFSEHKKAWTVTSNYFQLQASISKSGAVRYYVIDIYNSSTEYEEIDMDALERLRKVVEVLMENDLLR